MDNIEKKRWGSTRLIHMGESIQLNRAEIEPGGYCSYHFHRCKHNGFFVEEGSVDILWEEPGEKTTPKIIRRSLSKGDSLVIPPMVRHMFSSKKGCLLFEYYWSSPSKEDIERCGTLGGIKSV